MTRAQRLAILGERTVAEIHQRVAKAPPPPADLLEELRPILAPALHRLRQKATAPTQQAAA